jgi:hypothetical protein
MTRGDLDRLAGYMSSQQAKIASWPPDERFWFSGVAGAELPEGHGRILRWMWTCMLAALDAAITGRKEDNPKLDLPTGLFGTIRRALETNRVEGTATTELERAVGPDVWLAVIAIWNASCAALLSDTLDQRLIADLESAWRAVLGTTPREYLAHPEHG